MRRTSAGNAPRHPLWTRERFLEDFQKYGEIRKVCQIYSDTPEKYKPYETDVWRWRQDDPEFDEEVSKILVERSRKGLVGGRKRNDDGDKSWQQDYCDALVKNHLALDKAAAVTPYSVRTIQEMQSMTSTQYDAEFCKMVEEAELIVSSRAREMMLEGIKPENYEDRDSAAITQSKVFNNLKIIEKLEPKKFGSKKIELTGTVQHQHSHRLLPPNERMLMLVEDRQRFMTSRANEIAALPPAPAEQDEQEIIEADVIES